MHTKKADTEAAGTTLPDIHQLMEDILTRLSSVSPIQVEDIPNIDLYMDQVTTFMENCLNHTRRNEEDKVLTKTMINNYAKNKLLPPPVKKKYSREHILIMIFIYYFKSILSLQDIQIILKPLTDRYFENQEDISVSKIYQNLLDAGIADRDYQQADISHILEKADAAVADVDEEDREFLQYFSVICFLIIDVVMKKRMIEELIDSYSHRS